MSFNFAEYSPALRHKKIQTTTWGATPNTCTITDPKLTTNSMIEIWVTGTTPQAGQWSFTYGLGSVVITSANAESSTLPLSYFII